MSQLSELTNKELTSEQIFEVYQSEIEGLPKSGSKFKTLTKSKNELIRSIVEKQMAENGRFKIEPPDNACPDCRGLGEIYRLRSFHPIKEPCRKCEKDKNGKPTGLFKKECNTCKGSGRFKKKEFGLTIDVECKYCAKDENGKPSGYRLVKCRTCQGTGVFQKFPMTGKIESSTLCKRCQGSGIKPSNHVGTPVLSQEMAKMLQEVLDES